MNRCGPCRKYQKAWLFKDQYLCCSQQYHSLIKKSLVPHIIILGAAHGTWASLWTPLLKAVQVFLNSVLLLPCLNSLLSPEAIRTDSRGESRTGRAPGMAGRDPVALASSASTQNHPVIQPDCLLGNTSRFVYSVEAAEVQVGSKPAGVRPLG